MKCLAVFVVVVIVGGTVASKCCMPSMFTGVQPYVTASSIGGRMSISTGLTNVTYDAVNNRSYTQQDIDVQGSSYHDRITTIADFKRGVAYTIINGVCTKSVVAAADFYRYCIPDDAVPVFDMTLGLGVTQMAASAYSFQVNNASVTATITTNCVPIVLVIQGNYSQEISGQKENVPYLTTSGFLNLHEGITSEQEAVFTPPASCNNVPTTAAPAGARKSFFGAV